MKRRLLSYVFIGLAAGVLSGPVLYPGEAGAEQPPIAQAPQQNQQEANPPAGTQGEKDKPYTVICQNTAQGTRTCKVDRGTYQGWRTYHAFCYQCHAQDAVGSSFAPSLVERMKQIDKQRFVHSVTNGYKGQIGVMPAWRENPNVMNKINELYSYLRARSDGVLSRGRPERLPDEPATAGR